MKTAVITGASSGIGYEFAKILAREKYQLVLIARNLDRLNDIKQEFEKIYGINVILMPADLSLENVVEGIVKELRYRQLLVEVLINSAGFGYGGEYVRQSWDNEKDMIQVNVKNLSHLTKLILPLMLERKYGRICNLSSTAAFYPGPFMAVYYASKAYILSYSQALANELKKTGVTVTCLCPGPTITNFQTKAGVENNRLFRASNMAVAKDVAEFGFKAMMKGKVLAIPGVKNNFFLFISRFMSRQSISNFVRNINS
ncbi:MAG: SDR family oxidoreductase [Candidatus Omnitrophica bacterium]|nr:SDR family oxidoreductase [Candidatus Omnitrophota bacterium]